MIELRAAPDVIKARLAARDLVRSAGLGVMDQTRFATAVSELGRHALARPSADADAEVRCELLDLSDARVHRLQATVSDDGGAQRHGLESEAPGVRQLVDVFAIETTDRAVQVTVQIVRLRNRPR